ncbi:MAG: alcohol dehydrogenase catalytic domain-containing protein [Chloroflexi bacterium]|nr:alcohol dehydrogenase catalytic domain-containing protein [Chloroflexota bacterium]
MRDLVPAQMRALVLPSPGKFKVETVPVPVPGAGEVLCKVRAVAICGSDPEILRGDLAGRWPPQYPFIPGHEWAGQVVALGPDVLNLQVGDRVAGQAHKGCGNCKNCMEGRYTICENYGCAETGQRHYGFTTQGAYAQYIAISIKSVDKIPDSMTFGEGAMVDTAGVVEHGLALCGITPGGTVAVIGPGPIGLIAMRLARVRGAARILAVGRGARLQASLKAGADVLVDFEKTDPVEAVRGATGGVGVDEAVECSGAAGTFRQAVEMVRKGGRVALVGVPPDQVVEPLPFKYIVHNEIAIYGSRANPNSSRRVIPLIGAKQLVVSDLITHRFPLEQFTTALDYFVRRRENAIKVIIEPNGPETEGAGLA